MGTENKTELAPAEEGVESRLREHTNDLLSNLGSEAELPEPGPSDVDAEAAVAEAARKARDEKGRFSSATKPAEEAKPAVKAAAKPEGEQPAPAVLVEEPEPEGGWKAEAQRLRETRERERGGFQRTLQELRQSSRQMPYMPPVQQPQPQMQQPAQGLSDRLPIEFDEQGRPFVPAAALAPVLQQLAPRPQPMDPATVRRTLLGRVQQDMINRDPVNNAPVVNRLFTAIETADQLVQAKQQEIGGYTFQSMDQLVDFMEGTGVAAVLREQFPELLSAPEDLETLVEGALGVNHRKLERLLARGRAAATPPSVPGVRAPTQLRALPASKPRSQATRGTPEVSSNREARLAILEAKSPLEWTKEEAREYQRYTKELDAAG